MIETLGDRQQQLLALLLRNKAGLTVDDLSQQLQITRNAVRQHLAALERDDLVQRGETKPSGGRPEQLMRFRREVVLERPAPGVRLGATRRASLV